MTDRQQSQKRVGGGHDTVQLWSCGCCYNDKNQSKVMKMVGWDFMGFWCHKNHFHKRLLQFGKANTQVLSFRFLMKLWKKQTESLSADLCVSQCTVLLYISWGLINCYEYWSLELHLCMPDSRPSSTNSSCVPWITWKGPFLAKETRGTLWIGTTFVLLVIYPVPATSHSQIRCPSTKVLDRCDVKILETSY